MVIKYKKEFPHLENNEEPLFAEMVTILWVCWNKDVTVSETISPVGLTNTLIPELATRSKGIRFSIDR